MLKLVRTDSSNEDFKTLVKLLDAELAIRDGEEHSFYDQFNKIDAIKHIVLIYDSQEPCGCGAIKQYDNDTMEVKRMYVAQNYRNLGIATTLLNELKKWASELAYHRLILETGINQPEAIHLYKKYNFKQIPNYGPYEGKEMSLCFEMSI